MSTSFLSLLHAKTQKEQNMQKEQKNKNCTCVPAISTLYLLTGEGAINPQKLFR